MTNPTKAPRAPKPFPSCFQYWTVDAVAECTNVGRETYRALWALVGNGSNQRPLGGDGTGGTVEEPVISDSFSNGLPACWNLLPESARQEIRRVAVPVALEDLASGRRWRRMERLKEAEASALQALDQAVAAVEAAYPTNMADEPFGDLCAARDAAQEAYEAAILARRA